jgi:hypothetical protein
VSVVVRLGDYRTKDAVAVLRELLVLASRGKVAAFGFNVELKDGTQKTGFTGKYAADPAEALRVATRMSQRLNAIQDLRDAAAAVADEGGPCAVRRLRKQ